MLPNWPSRDAGGRVLRPAAGQVGTLHEQLRKAAAPRPRPAFSTGDLEQLRRQVLRLQRRLFGEGGRP